MKLLEHHMVAVELHHEIQHDHNPLPQHQVVPLSQKERHCIYLINQQQQQQHQQHE